MSAILTIQVNKNGLRELSQSEQVKVIGAAACYENPPGFANPYRWANAGANVIVQQKWNGSKYANTGNRYNLGDKTFKQFCAARGGYFVPGG